MSRQGMDRVTARPSPAGWEDEELMTLAEAARLYWPHGPITVTTLRTAVRQGDLGIVVLAGKHFTTPAAIRAMGRRGRRHVGDDDEA